MTIITDLLIYKEGLYHRTDDSFKFNGQHVVKIVGWDRQGKGADYCIMENSWGPDWGENCYMKVLASDKSSQLDFYAIGVAVYPTPWLSTTPCRNKWARSSRKLATR